MHFGAELLADHAARIGDAALRVEPEAGRQRSAARRARLRAPAAAAASEHAVHVVSPTALPPHADLARRGAATPSRPPDMLTMTLSTSTPAIRSAASMARRIALSAASRSTIAPALTPRER